MIVRMRPINAFVVPYTLASVAATTIQNIALQQLQNAIVRASGPMRPSLGTGLFV
jgi:hypothetical protein